MKPYPKYFEKIRVRPDPDAELKSRAPVCQWDGCQQPGTHRAPVGRMKEGEYFRFCFDHVREYNKGFNYFSGLADSEIARFQKEALTGHRPTWKMGMNGSGRTKGPAFGPTTDPLGFFREFGGRSDWQPPPEPPESERRMIRNVERKALDTLGLEVDATKAEIKTRFKLLVKRHHPDANGGDRSFEDRLRDIIQAYNYLKAAGYC